MQASTSSRSSSLLRHVARPSLPSRRRLPKCTCSAPSSRGISTINPDEISHFASLSSTWWDEKGDFNVLQRMNKVRVEFLRERLGMTMMDNERGLEKLKGPKFLDGLSVLDVGCGGGLFAERLARLGANTLAIDASNENVQTATLHASQDPHLLSLIESGRLEYRHSAAEHLLEPPDAEASTITTPPKEQFDIVCAMEVIEHVDDPPSFLRCLADLTKPGGHLILSTISRTPLSNLVLIKLAESSLLRFAPPGSHTHSKFIKPSELSAFVSNELGWSKPASSSSFSSTLSDAQNKGTESIQGHLTPDQRTQRYEQEVRGTTYWPWKGEWELFAKDDPGQGVLGELRKSCNYFFGARKPL